MGCDIHIYTEVKKTINNQNKWVSSDYFKMNNYKYEDKFSVVEIFKYRNYSLFSVLANVRNYDNNKFISEPKGYPDDCCEFINGKFSYWGEDGHSHSYFTLKELLDFQKENEKIKHSGMMSLENAKLVDSGLMPNSWCKATNIESYVFREWSYKNEALDKLINSLKQRKEDFYINNDEDIRIVFWFDS